MLFTFHRHNLSALYLPASYSFALSKYPGIFKRCGVSSDLENIAIFSIYLEAFKIDMTISKTRSTENMPLVRNTRPRVT